MKFSSLITASLLSLGLCALPSLSNAKPIKLVLGHPNNEANNEYQAWEFFGKRVAELSKGDIVVEIHPNGEIVNENTAVDSVRFGSVDICTIGSNNASQWTNTYFFGDLPYIWDSIESSHKVWWGPIGKELSEKASKDLKVKVLGYIDNGCGFRVLTNSKHEVRVPADTKDLKLRISASTEKTLFNIWGCAGTPVTWSEVYSALEQKVIDGQLLHPAYIFWTKQYEVLKYITEDSNGIANVRVVMMSPKAWKKLNKAQQDIIYKALDETGLYNAEISKKMADKFKADLIKVGMKWYTPTPEEKALWKADAMKVWELFKDSVPQDLVKRVVEAQK